jgi:hypothetical protein
MAPRPEDDTLKVSELAELKRNLLLLSGSGVQNYYRDVHKECSLEHDLIGMPQSRRVWKHSCYRPLVRPTKLR